MAAGVPVVGLDAPGVRAVIEDSYNGRLINEESRDIFCETLRWMMALSPQNIQQLKSGARETAKAFSLSRSADTALRCFEALLGPVVLMRPAVAQHWDHILSLFQAEWDIIKGVAGAAGVALGNSKTQRRT